MKQADEELELGRLLAREEPGLGPLVAELQGRVPDATELASLSSRLALSGIDVAPQPTPTVTKPWKKWLVAGTGVSAALLWLGLRSQPSVPRPPSAERAPAVAVAPAGQPGSARALPSRDAPAGGIVPAAKPGAVTETPADAPVAALPTTQHESSGTAPAPPVPGGVGAAREPAVLAPMSRAGSAGAPRDGASASAPDLKSESAAAPTELELLRDARLSLRSSPAHALELAEQHAHAYPSGKMTQERELIAISALVALGRRTAALSRGARFEQAFPASPYRKQVGELLR